MSNPADPFPPDETALTLFNTRRLQNLPTVLVFYRGEKSYFCRAWIKRWLSTPALHRRLSISHAQLHFISSQSQGKAYSLAEQLHLPLTNTPTNPIHFFGDPHHDLLKRLDEVGVTTPYVTGHDGGSYRAHGWFYDRGMIQPAVIAVMGEEVLFEWVLKPSLKNGGGKLKRQDPWEIWDYIERKLDRVRFERGKRERSTENVGQVVGVKSIRAAGEEKDGGYLKTDIKDEKKVGEETNQALLNPDSLTTEVEDAVVKARDTSKMKSVPPRDIAVGATAAGAAGAAGVAAMVAGGDDGAEKVVRTIVTTETTRVVSVKQEPTLEQVDEVKEHVVEPASEPYVVGTENDKNTGTFEKDENIEEDVTTGAVKEEDILVGFDEEKERAPLAFTEQDVDMDRGVEVPMSAVTVGGEESMRSPKALESDQYVEPTPVTDDTNIMGGVVGGGDYSENVDTNKEDQLEKERPRSSSPGSGQARTSAGVLIHSFSEDDTERPKSTTRRSIAKELDMAHEDEGVVNDYKTEDATTDITTDAASKDIGAGEEAVSAGIGDYDEIDTEAKTGGVSQPVVPLYVREGGNNAAANTFVEPATEAPEADVGETADLDPTATDIVEEYEQEDGDAMEKRKSLTFAEEPEIVPQPDMETPGEGSAERNIPDVEASPVGVAGVAAARDARPGSTISSYSSVKETAEGGEDLYGGEGIKDEYEDLADPVAEEYPSPPVSAARSSSSKAFEKTQVEDTPVVGGMMADAGEIKRMDDVRDAAEDDHGVYEEYEGYEEVDADEGVEEEEKQDEDGATGVMNREMEEDEDLGIESRNKDDILARDMSRDAQASVEGSSDVRIVPVTGALSSPGRDSVVEGDTVTSAQDTEKMDRDADIEEKKIDVRDRESPFVAADATEAERRSIEADMENDPELEGTSRKQSKHGPLATVKHAGRKVAWFWGLDRFLPEHKTGGDTNEMGGVDTSKVARTASSGGYRSEGKKATRKNTLGNRFSKLTGRRSIGDDTLMTGRAAHSATPPQAPPVPVADTEMMSRQDRINDEMDMGRLGQKSSFVGRLSGRLGRSPRTSSEAAEGGRALERKSSLTSKIASPGKVLLSKLSVSYGDGPQTHRQSFRSSDAADSLPKSAEVDPVEDTQIPEPTVVSSGVDTRKGGTSLPRKKTWTRFLPSKKEGDRMSTEGATPRVVEYAPSPRVDTEEDTGEIHGDTRGPGINEMDAIVDEEHAKVKRKNTIQILKDSGKKFAWFWGFDAGKKKSANGGENGEVRVEKKPRRSNVEGKTGGGLFAFRRNKSEEVRGRSGRNSLAESPRRLSKVRSMFGRA